VRRLAARAHRWGGLLLGPVAVVLGLSGATLVFRAELDTLGGMPAVTSGAPRPLDAIRAAALLTEPSGEVRALRLPVAVGQPYHVEIVHGDRRVDVAVDPVTLRVLERRAPERSVLAAVHALHARFHAGRLGAAAVALVGVVLVVESVVGLWLYGPRRLRRGRGSRGLHRVVGAVSLAVGLVVGLTGVALALLDAATRAGPVATGGLAGLDALAAGATAAMPGGTLTTLAVEGHELARADLRVVGGAATVLLDRRTAAVVAVRPVSSDGAWGLVRRLHYGDFAGWPSRAAWTLAGLALPVLTITGYLLASRPRRASVADT